MHPPSLSVQLLLYTAIISAVGVLPPYSRLEVPFAHVALSGDVQVWLHAPPLPLPALAVSVWRLAEGRPRFVADVQLLAPTSSASSAPNATRLTLPCGYLSKGGTYLLRLRPTDQNLTEAETYEDAKLSGVLDVRWPTARISITPENIQTFPEHSVTGIIEFPEVMCPAIEETTPPEFSFELSYCGESLCKPGNGEGSYLYSEQIVGFPGRRELQLRCELFGAAGTYALALRPAQISSAPALTPTPAYLKVSWSEQFVLNVHGRSVLPCDGHEGMTVFVQYPACVLERGDRVRVYAREPPRTALATRITNGDLRYITELRVTRGNHKLNVPCDLFSERFPEYCFIYVSEALNGAVADVRQECLPTLPILDGGLPAGWGPWSGWSACPPGCGGTRTRYRFCDSPMPSSGAPYCKGEAVESERCTGDHSVDGKLCPWDDLLSGLKRINIGSDCQCGCVLRLGSMPRSLAASAQACKGRTFWLLQASPGYVVRLVMEKYRLSCGAQWLKARDGDSPGAVLLAEWPGEDGESHSKDEHAISPVLSSGPSLLLEFFSDELLAASPACPGGYVAEASQIEAVAGNASASISNIRAGNARSGGIGGLLLIVLLAAAFILTAPAACWITLRVLHASRKYHRAADCDSLADSDIGPGSAAALSNRLTGSSGTLLSEVLSLRRLRVRGGGIGDGHRLLRESKDLSEERPLDAPQVDGGDTQTSGWSSGSSVTLAAVDETSPDMGNNRDRPGSRGSLPAGNSSNVDSTHASPLRRSRTCSPARSAHVTSHHPPYLNSLISDGDTTSMSIDISTSERDSDNSCDNRDLKKAIVTPRVVRKTAISENGSRSGSNTTLTNGCYSPALSSTSCARVRSTNGKERKERRNLRLRAPLSDLSLAAPEFEMDYYDYNVSNAGAAPGSYIGMDPAFLVWIPPLEEGDIIKEMDEQNIYDEIIPQHNVDPGSNTESPEEYNDQPHLTRPHIKSEEYTPQGSPRIERRLAMKTNIVHPLNFSISDLLPAKREGSFFEPNRKNDKNVTIQMKELSNNRYQYDVSNKTSEQSDEKETFCEKSPSRQKERFSDISDIQFADDDSDNSDELKFADGQANKQLDNQHDQQKFMKI